ncbi:MAG: porin family protein [Tannerella sp.]|jgi:outer membrane protein X|nr:porin family protein [Tannerella sp.]
MKRLIIPFILFITCLHLNAQTQKGEWSLGYSGGASLKTESGFLCIDYRYNLTNGIRIAPSVRKYLRWYGYRGAGGDFDIQYAFPIGGVLNVYPFLGASFTYWDYLLDGNTKEYAEGQKSFGGNIGLGTEINIIDDIMIGIEAKYNYTEINKQPIVGIRVGYVFK